MSTKTCKEGSILSGKRWLGLFLSALLLVLALWGCLNFFVDPFGVFGNQTWDSYSQTLNPRTGKGVYLSKNLDQYDSYIIGSSSAASYDPEVLESYLGGSFYNLFHYGADTAYDRALVEYLLRADDDVKQIFLVLGINEANQARNQEDSLTDRGYYRVTGESPLTYYSRFLFASPSFAREKLDSQKKDTVLPQTFDVFLPESGCYDKQIRDVESIGALDAYLQKNGGDFLQAQEPKELAHIAECAENVAAIQDLCQSAGVSLTVVLSPVTEAQLMGYTDETLDEYVSAISQITAVWNFSVSPITYDPRYFYDVTHPRNAVGTMVLARIFENKDVYYPDEFGVLCQNGEAVSTARLREKAKAVTEERYTETVPILLYHHLSDDKTASKDTTMPPELFQRHMALLKERGYETVTFADLIAYVNKGTPLPENPVVVTFDDGYLSNYEYAYPILKEQGFQATVFVIGCSVGHEKYYKDTDYEMTPHFGLAEIQEMAGTISIGSHTYDMHQWRDFESGDTVRTSMLPLEGESESDYIAALTEDAARQDQLFSQLGLEKSTVLAFPTGAYTTLTDVTLKKLGYQVTLTTDSSRVNTLVQGLPQSLVDLGRFNVSADTTDEALLSYLEHRQ